jgi:hypothetical protein
MTGQSGCDRCTRAGYAALALALAVAGCDGGAAGPAPQGQALIEPLSFSAEVQTVLDRKTADIETLAATPEVVEAVRVANEQNAGLTQAEIRRLDAQWQAAEGVDDFIKPFVTNDCALLLIDFQDTHDGFAEIFVTDRSGLIVAETNKTSDYYQADEDWWIDAFAEGRGKAYHGPLEYDESAQSEAISVYVPVRDPQTDEAIGVMKAVCDLTAIKMEL